MLEAIYAKKINVVEFLLNEGADPNLRSAPFYDEHDNLIPEDSPLEAVIVFDTLFSTADLLIENGANVNLKDFDSRLTPLDWITIEIGVYRTEITKLLIKNGAAIDYALARNYGAEEILKGVERNAR